MTTWNPDPSAHHPYCQFYRESGDCTCAEGKDAAKVTYTIVLTKNDAYEREEWTATVAPPLNDAGPYIRWISVLDLLEAIGEDIEGKVPA